MSTPLPPSTSPNPQLRVGTLADDQMLTGPLPRRRELLARARQAGLDHVFVADHISFYTGLGMDGLIQAATIAALEPDLAIHIGVYLLALRHPLPVARQVATLCESAPGRLHLGVGVGGEDRHEVEICGVDPRTRGLRTNESIMALRGLLSGRPVSHHSPFFSFQDALIKPAPDPAVPIVVGGRSDAAIRRAALLGDGWLGVWCSAKRFAQVLAQIKALASERSLPAPETWDHGLQVWIGLGDDAPLARARLAKRMEGMYHTPFEHFEKYSPFGRPSEIAQFLAPYIAAGCRHLNIMPVAESTEAGLEGAAEIRERLLAMTSSPAPSHS
jgi:alkanesulfonate monooxygenase SsuD/methylene tetrahydromethanopterin reductase-like flavin-dependent oxidoreductase (luciferase family)